LLYKAWLKYRFSHNAIEGTDECYWEIIFSILGLPREFRQSGDLSAQFLRYAGIINQRPKTQTGLKTILSDYLSPIPVDIEPCVLRQVGISKRQRSRLGRANNTLGQDSVIGEQVSDRSGKYIVRIGPLSMDQFQQLINTRPQLRFIHTISKLFLVQPLLCDIVMELEPGAARPICLGDSEYSSLGQSTWLISQTNADIFNVVLN
jgi:type VI secretion system protein ImpH